MSYSSSPPRPYQIDIAGEIALAYRTVIDNQQRVVEMALLPFLIMLAAQIVVRLIFSSGIGFGASFGGLVLGIVQIIFATVFTVRWYRFLLLSETVGGGLIPPGWSESIIVTIKLALLVLAGVVPIVIVTLLLPFLLGILPWLGGLVLGFAILRLSLVFPAAAVQRPVPLLTAWNWMEGNYWRLVASALGCYLPFVIAGLVLAAITGWLPWLLQIIVGAAQLAISFAGWAVIGVLLASLYRQIGGGAERA